MPNLSRCYINNVWPISEVLGTTPILRSDATIMQQHTVKSVGGEVLKLISWKSSFLLTQQSKSVVDRLVVEVSRSHTTGRTPLNE